MTLSYGLNSVVCIVCTSRESNARRGRVILGCYFDGHVASCVPKSESNEARPELLLRTQPAAGLVHIACFSFDHLLVVSPLPILSGPSSPSSSLPPVFTHSFRSSSSWPCSSFYFPCLFSKFCPSYNHLYFIIPS